MARIVRNGAIVSDSAQWYWAGLKWKPLLETPANDAPGLFSRERMGLSTYARGRTISDMRIYGEELRGFMDANGGDLDRALEAAPNRSVGGAAAPPPKAQVQIKKYKGEKEFQRDATKLLRDGWHIEGQSTRTKKWSLTTGFFTNKGISTVTWIKGGAA